MRQNRVISLPVIFRLADGEGAMKVWLSGLAKSSHKFVFETAGRVLDLLDPLGILWRRLEAGLGLAKLLD